MVTKKKRSQSQIALKKIKKTVAENQKWIVFGIVTILIATNINALVEIFEPEDNRIQIEEPTPFDFASPVPGTTYYHFDGARNAAEFYEINGTSVLYGNNIPIFSQGTYYSIGMSTFEPTVGVTSSVTPTVGSKVLIPIL